ncbi:DNA-binding transcriptional regulator, ArsR family [Seinonella peptonophila]|uniref:DNA-binding transcriptional regulator, ArsR family n=1 Tax=Seinonella peptonophila TaxID=112248 RepID=A0A1M4WI02_9BACL|nr:metalloregulator ArsR/SmtB family transcription factor [Seinonella peptonophila]SHE80790.1 DNA-binding transcriptional regulator, ArsR family [Seinonella peptonophila]
MMMDHFSSDQAVNIYKSLGEPTRYLIVQLLLQHNQLSCTEIKDKINQVANSTLSHHLKLLKDCQVLQCTRRGKLRLYSCNKEVLTLYAPYLLK